MVTYRSVILIATRVEYDLEMKARALADRMGGAAPLAMLCLDPQALRFGMSDLET